MEDSILWVQINPKTPILELSVDNFVKALDIEWARGKKVYGTIN
jgi:hypothetical protein